MIWVVGAGTAAVLFKLFTVAWNRDLDERARHESYMREVWRLR